MKFLDHFYEEELAPLCEGLGEYGVEAITQICDWSISALLWVTVPVWIVPYLIVRKIKRSEKE